MKPKKFYCNIIISFVIFCIIAGIGTIAKFGNRIEAIKQSVECETFIKLTTSDLIFAGCVVAVFWIILSIYWLYTTAYVVYKAKAFGTNAMIFGVLTFVTNVFGAACLWVYVKLHSVCPGCGKIQSLKANNCSYCGTAIYIKCPDCGSRVSVKDKYCNGCGNKMSE